MIPQIFNYEDNELTVLEDDDWNPWFVAKEICDILELTNVSSTVSAINEKNLRIISTDTKGIKRSMAIVDETGLYKIIINSRKPKAEKFVDWITSEVLPSIRKTGQYSVKQLTQLEVAKQLVASLEETEQLKLESRKLKKEQIQLTGEVKKLKPKAEYADSALLPGINVSINVFAKTNGFKPNVLTKWFRDEKILMTGKHKNDKKHLVPYQEWTKYFECIQETYEKANGEKDYRIKPLIMHDKQPLLLKYIHKNAPGLVFKNKPKELMK